LLLNFRKD
jgi:hypothetical protein